VSSLSCVQREIRATTLRGEVPGQGCVTGTARQPLFTQRAARAEQLGPPAQVQVSIAQLASPSDSNSSRNDDLSAATTAVSHPSRQSFRVRRSGLLTVRARRVTPALDRPY
jgi:hypothetical protein